MTFPLLSRTFLRKLSFHFWFPVPGTGKGTAKKRGRAYDGTKGSFLPAAFLAGRSLGGDSLDQPILPGVPQSFKVSGAASVGIFLLGLGKVIEDTGCVKM